MHYIISMLPTKQSIDKYSRPVRMIFFNYSAYVENNAISAAEYLFPESNEVSHDDAIFR